MKVTLLIIYHIMLLYDTRDGSYYHCMMHAMDQGMTDGPNKRWISEQWIGISNRSRCTKMKV